MPPRDEQDWQSRRDQILAGALVVFADKGFERATNKDIAEAANIGSPGLIYHYFKDKADVFKQMVERHVPVLQVLDHSAELWDLPPREALTHIGNAMIKTFENRSVVAVFKVVMGESFRRPAVAEMVNRIGPGRGIPFLTQYLQHQMDMGVLKQSDAGAAARCFIGPLIAWMLTREVFPQADTPNLAPETMLATMIDIFLQGLDMTSTNNN